MARTIFSTVRAPHDPAFTVGSLATTHTGRPVDRADAGDDPVGGQVVRRRRWPAERPPRRSPSSSRSASRSRTNSFPCRASLSASLCRLPPQRSGRAGRELFVHRESLGYPRRMARIATSSVIGSVAKSRAASSERLAEHVGRDAGIAPQRVGDAVLAEELLAGAGLGQPVGVEQEEVAGVERDLSARVLAVRVEHQQRAGGPQRAHLAVVPQPGGRVPGGRDPERGRLGVEHDHADRDELLEALERRHLPVQLLERLGRIAVLPQEHPQQVLGLEGGDRRLDAVAGDVADDRRDAGGRDRGTRRRSRRP